MLDRSAQLAARYVRTHEAARILGISPRTLEKYRCHGSGPTFRKLGGRGAVACLSLSHESVCGDNSCLLR